MDIADYLQVFRRYWKTVTITTVAAALIALAVGSVLPSQYRATALLYVSAQSKTATLFELSQVSLQRAASYPELASSPAVLEPVREILGLPLTLDQLAAKVKVSNPTGTLFVAVDATDSDPKLAAAIANEVARSLTVEARSLESAAGSQGTVSLTTATNAVAPGNPDAPVKALALGLGILIGLFVGGVIAILLDRRRTQTPTPAAIETISGVPVLGSIEPSRRLASRGNAPVQAQREVVLGLLQETNGEIPGVLLVVPVPDTAAVRRGIHDLAAGLTGAGRRVVLLQASAGRKDRPGISELLAGTADATGLVPADAGLHVVGAGDPDAAPARKGLVTRTGTVLRQLRKLTDVTVIVATETSRPVDTSLAARGVDAVLLFVDARPGVADQVRQAAAELAVHQIVPVGVVLVGQATARPARQQVEPVGVVLEGTT
jgi:capsular polysaccharide biosynthesis protein